MNNIKQNIHKPVLFRKIKNEKLLFEIHDLDSLSYQCFSEEQSRELILSSSCNSNIGFNNGDIFIIDQSSKIRKLFDSQSVHNSLFVTNHCNQRCLFCSQPPKERDDLNYFHKINSKLVELLPIDLQSIGITGGEPTLLGNRLLQLLQKINQYLPNTNIHLLSNGIYYSDIDHALNLSNSKVANLTLGIPLYSYNHNVHNHIVQSDSFFNLINALHNLGHYGINIELRIVISKLNFKDLPLLAEFIYKNLPFVYHVAFMGLENTGLAKKNIDECWINPLDYCGQLNEAVSFLSICNFDVSIYNIPLCQMGNECWQYSRDSISEWKKRYHNKCDICSMKNLCSGLFNSSFNKYNELINPINSLGVEYEKKQFV